MTGQISHSPPRRDLREDVVVGGGGGGGARNSGRRPLNCRARRAVSSGPGAPRLVTGGRAAGGGAVERCRGCHTDQLAQCGGDVKWPASRRRGSSI